MNGRTDGCIQQKVMRDIDRRSAKGECEEDG